MKWPQQMVLITQDKIKIEWVDEDNENLQVVFLSR